MKNDGTKAAPAGDPRRPGFSGRLSGATNSLGFWNGAVSRAAVVCATLMGSWGLACWLVAASAGEARVVEGSGPGHVIVDASDASAEEVLGALAAQFEFTLEHGARPSQPIRYSGRLEGSLDQLLDRLLRHQGHMIVRSAEARAGISSVVLLETKERAPPPTVGSAIAALKAKLQQQNSLKDSEEPGK